MSWQRKALGTALGAAVAYAALQWTTAAQTQRAAAGPGDRPRFEFVIIEAFNGKYLGDTPGYSGRGSLNQATPRVALGDPVYHGDRQIGEVTGVAWDRTKDSLEVEFDPAYEQLGPHRITVGETVWIAINRPTEKAKPR